MGLPRSELPPTAHLGLRPYVSAFVTSYLHQSPLALLSVVVARDGIAHVASPLSTSEDSILGRIEARYFLVNPPTGMMSLENSLRVALATLEVDVDKVLAAAASGDRAAPLPNRTNSYQRRIVVVTGSVSVLDPGDVMKIVRVACADQGIVVDVVSLSGAPYVLAAAASATHGQFHCPISGGGDDLLRIMEGLASLRSLDSGAVEGPTITGDDEEALGALLGESAVKEEAALQASPSSTLLLIGTKRERREDGEGRESIDAVALANVVSMGLPQSSLAHGKTPLPQSLGLITQPLNTTTAAHEVDVGPLLPQLRCPRCAALVSLPSVCPVCCLIVSSLPLMHGTYVAMNSTRFVPPTATSGLASPPRISAAEGSSADRYATMSEVISKLVVRCSLCGSQGIDNLTLRDVVTDIRDLSSTHETIRAAEAEASLRARCLAVALVDAVGLEQDWAHCSGCQGRRCESCETLVKKAIGMCPTCCL